MGEWTPWCDTWSAFAMRVAREYYNNDRACAWAAGDILMGAWMARGCADAFVLWSGGRIWQTIAGKRRESVLKALRRVVKSSRKKRHDVSQKTPQAGKPIA